MLPGVIGWSRLILYIHLTLVYFNSRSPDPHLQSVCVFTAARLIFPQINFSPVSLLGRQCDTGNKQDLWNSGELGLKVGHINYKMCSPGWLHHLLSLNCLNCKNRNNNTLPYRVMVKTK